MLILSVRSLGSKLFLTLFPLLMFPVIFLFCKSRDDANVLKTSNEPQKAVDMDVFLESFFIADISGDFPHFATPKGSSFWDSFNWSASGKTEKKRSEWQAEIAHSLINQNLPSPEEHAEAKGFSEDEPNASN